MTRRRWLQGMFALTAASLSGSLALKALADDTSGSPIAGSPIDLFMTFSQSLTAKSNLDRDVGLRLLAALQKSVPDLQQQLPKLAAALAAGSADAAQQTLALKILEAWYLGTVDNAVIIFEHALMFGVVSDTLVIRSYCANQPGYWAAKPFERQA